MRTVTYFLLELAGLAVRRPGEAPGERPVRFLGKVLGLSYPSGHPITMVNLTSVPAT